MLKIQSDPGGLRFLPLAVETRPGLDPRLPGKAPVALAEARQVFLPLKPAMHLPVRPEGPAHGTRCSVVVTGSVPPPGAGATALRAPLAELPPAADRARSQLPVAFMTAMKGSPTTRCGYRAASHTSYGIEPWM